MYMHIQTCRAICIAVKECTSCGLDTERVYEWLGDADGDWEIGETDNVSQCLTFLWAATYKERVTLSFKIHVTQHLF